MPQARRVRLHDRRRIAGRAACGALDIAAVQDFAAGRVPEGIVERRVLTHPAWLRRLEENRRLRGREA